MKTKKQTICFPEKDKNVFMEAFKNPLSTKKEMKEALRYYHEKRQEVRT